MEASFARWIVVAADGTERHALAPAEAARLDSRHLVGAPKGGWLRRGELVADALPRTLVLAGAPDVPPGMTVSGRARFVVRLEQPAGSPGPALLHPELPEGELLSLLDELLECWLGLARVGGVEVSAAGAEVPACAFLRLSLDPAPWAVHCDRLILLRQAMAITAEARGLLVAQAALELELPAGALATHPIDGRLYRRSPTAEAQS